MSYSDNNGVTVPGIGPQRHGRGIDTTLAHLACGRGDVIDIRYPVDGSVIGQVRYAREKDVDEAVRRARQAQRSWAQTSVRERARIIIRFASLVLERSDDILDSIQLETGKNRLSAFEEVMDVARLAANTANTAASVLASRKARGAFPLLTQVHVERAPRGVVGVIAPWNYPFTLAVTDVVPALIAGNAVILKPDPATVFTALLVRKLFDDAGLPRDLFIVTPGEGPTVGTWLIDRVDYMTFTGSTETGRTIAARCAQRLIGCSTELGGKNPMIVLNDADIDRAVAGAVAACFSNTGQLCLSIERLYVMREIAEEFTQKFVRATQKLRIGGHLDWSIDVGSLISPAHMERVDSHVVDAVSKGATVLTGGHPRPDLGPAFYEPTILTDVPSHADLVRDETFGPVVALYVVDDEAEAIELANDTHYGLNASVWSRNIARARSVASQIESGTVAINDGYGAAWGSIDAPMGGWKESGIGRRHGREGILTYTQSRTVATQHVLPIGSFGPLDPEKFSRVMRRAIRVLNALKI
ncbi:succinic semialdehyde dehydrogenase [Arcanobacterium canis]